jgi:hypothetical protein
VIQAIGDIESGEVLHACLCWLEGRIGLRLDVGEIDWQEVQEQLSALMGERRLLARRSAITVSPMIGACERTPQLPSALRRFFTDRD